MTPAEIDALRARLDADAARIVLEAHVVDGPNVGYWCPHCNLPSAASGTIVYTAVLAPHHPPISRHHVAACVECETAWEVEG